MVQFPCLLYTERESPALAHIIHWGVNMTVTAVVPESCFCCHSSSPPVASWNFSSSPSPLPSGLWPSPLLLLSLSFSMSSSFLFFAMAFIGKMASLLPYPCTSLHISRSISKNASLSAPSSNLDICSWICAFSAGVNFNFLSDPKPSLSLASLSNVASTGTSLAFRSFINMAYLIKDGCLDRTLTKFNPEYSAANEPPWPSKTENME
mmetsp:Transcript_18759/g.28505  ORF Transcript_18759/g.28505 Transcript_18759/m.28505 type:complete len:207 (-) Transcript_18759:639-1259(-)